MKQKKLLETEIAIMRSQHQEKSEVYEKQLAESRNENRRLLKFSMDIQKELSEAKLQLSKQDAPETVKQSERVTF